MDKFTLLTENQKLKIIEYYIARTMHHTCLFYKIHAISRLTGSRHLSNSVITKKNLNLN